jgi:hypothetical protein
MILWISRTFCHGDKTPYINNLRKIFSPSWWVVSRATHYMATRKQRERERERENERERGATSWQWLLLCGGTDYRALTDLLNGWVLQ